MTAPAPVAVPAVQATLAVARTGIQVAAAAQGAPALLVAAGVGATFVLVGWGASWLLRGPRERHRHSPPQTDDTSARPQFIGLVRTPSAHHHGARHAVLET